MAKTVDGLLPLRVVWRRIDGIYADPLELKENSRLGTPGLLGAIRKQEVTVVNALGSGVLESRVWSAFLPELCKVLLHEELKLTNLQSFWWGDQEFQSRFSDEKDDWMISPAFSSNLVFEEDQHSLTEIDHSMVIAQERLSLSTTPAYRHQRLSPAPMTLRMFLVRTPDGWEVMPGGLLELGPVIRQILFHCKREERLLMSG